MPAVAAWFLYSRTGSRLALPLPCLYLLLRDSIGGQSLGKLLVGLVVVNVQTGRFCTWKESVLRNVFVLIPGANMVAVFLESITIIRDPQGQRLGDRIAQTQVIEGLGAKDLATFQDWWLSAGRHLDATRGGGRQPGRAVRKASPARPGAQGQPSAEPGTMSIWPPVVRRWIEEETRTCDSS